MSKKNNEKQEEQPENKPAQQKRSSELIVSLLGTYSDNVNDHRLIEIQYDLNNNEVVSVNAVNYESNRDSKDRFKIRAIELGIV